MIATESGSSRGAARRLWAGWPRLLPATWVCAMLACMLVPLPSGALDLLLSLSLALAVLLLVASLAVRRSVDFLSFPALVLLVTLARLTLNVATTRLILSQADAGRVIEAFAGLVVRGDLIVGAVMFALITAVQFLVIARGSERVAEVAARFALDGLPGHQAAIDADLRAGSISAEAAARRREALGERASFHGAMDGAARFVRGDAVAGLAITAINLVGGVAVGSLRHGLEVGASLALYGRLTIGDGLLAQIPALLVSLAAAVLVTRVDREAATPTLAWLEPVMLMVPAALLAGLALVPGMPRLAFALTALGLLGAGLWLASRREASAPEAPAPQIVLRLAGAPPELLRALRAPLLALRERCSAALGLELPTIVALAGPPAAPSEVRLGPRVLAGLALQDLGIGTGPEGHGLEDMANEPGDTMPDAARSGAAVSGAARSGAARSGLVLDAAVLACFRAIMGQAEVLLDLQQLEDALERTRRRHPAVVREALKVLSLPELLALSRGLLRERLPLPPLAALLEVVASEPRLRLASERPRWGELVREQLAGLWLRDLMAAHARLGPLRWVRPQPEAEAELRARAREGEGGLRLALRPGERAAWLELLRGEGSEPPLVVTTPGARTVFAALVRRSAPHITVLSTAELLAVDLPVPGEPGGPAARWCLLA